MELKKVILVTGASSGIGKETALQLIKEGHIVYGAARRIANMQELVEAGGHSIELDITNEEQTENAVNKIISEQKRIDVLVNNAGYAVYGAVEEVSIDDARQQFEVNIFGLARLTQLVIPYMRKVKKGSIINISSIGGKIYTPLGAWYHATKHALEGWSDSLRLELKEHGIKVVIIEPGLIKTAFGEVMYQPMLERSGNGAYSSLAKTLAAATEKSYQNDGGSPPSVIAAVVSKAVRSKNPRTRYAAGKMAKPILFMRKWLGDKTFDKAIMSQIK